MDFIALLFGSAADSEYVYSFPWLAFLAAAGTAVSAYGSYREGKDQSDSYREAARAGEWNAGKVLEASSMRAAEERRGTNRLMSDAQAIQAGSGFSATDPTSLRRLAEISGAGKYNELAIMYEGTTAAEAAMREADIKRDLGKSARTAGYLGAGSTLLTGFGSGGTFNDFGKAQGWIA